MKVLYIVYAPFPDDPPSQRALNMAKALGEKGFSVTFLVQRFNGSMADTPGDTGDHQGFRCVALGKPDSRVQFLRYMAYGRRVMSWLKQSEISGWDVIFLYNPLTIQHLQLQPYCRRHRIPIIVDCTEWKDSQTYPGLEWLGHRLDSEISTRYLNGRAGNVIGISSYLTNYYKSRNVRAIQIPPLIDLDDDKLAFDHTPVPPGPEVRIMYAGNPGRKDAIDKILDAFWLLKQAGVPAKLELVGVRVSQVENCGPYTKQRIQQLGDTLVIHGRFPTVKEALQKLSEADALILMKYPGKSAQAQFPSKIAEYTALGKPIIVNDTSDIKNYIHTGVEGFVIDGIEPETIAAAVQEVVQVRDQLPQMGKNSRIVAETQFSYQNYASNLFDFIAGAL